MTGGVQDFRCHQQTKYISQCLQNMTNILLNIRGCSIHNSELLKILWYLHSVFNTLRPRQNGRHFTDYVFKCIFLNENVWISLRISLEFVPKGLINNIPPLVQIMAWCRPGDKPLSEPMMISLLTHICITQPQWVNDLWNPNQGQTAMLLNIWTQTLSIFMPP